MLLNTELTYIPGIRPKKSAALVGELSICFVEDLLSYFPYLYIDRSRFGKIREINEESGYIQLRGKIVSIEKRGEGRSLRLVARFTDGSGYIDLVWFKGIRFIEDKYKLQSEYIVFGKLTLLGSLFNMAH